MRRKHRYEPPSDIHSTKEMWDNIVLAVAFMILIIMLSMARVALAAEVPYSVLMFL